MQTLLISTGVVALAELGDKTQLLTLVLALRFRRAWPIAWGILVATLANHAVAAWVGNHAAQLISPTTLRWSLALSLLAVAAWMLIPDRLDEEDASARSESISAWKAFTATTVAFFLAEIGDKTQIATVLLAAKFDAMVPVVVGTTLGMLAANIPVLWLGRRFADHIPLRATRIAAALLFTVLAAFTALSVSM